MLPNHINLEIKCKTPFKKLPKWFQEAHTENAVIDYSHRLFEWQRGTWINGTWDHGLWRSGEWLDGTWIKGVWFNGIWHKGIWHCGTWYKGKFIAGQCGINNVKVYGFDVEGEIILE
jgi:hypothetical protein